MSKIEMIKFGRTLTDRPYGQQVAEKIRDSETFPVSLDFSGVMSLGSSFGDEILSIIKTKQETIEVRNANVAIRACLEKVAQDMQVKIDFKV